MKWTSANSSDRKSVFYTSEDSNNIIASTKEQQLQRQNKLKSTSLTDNSTNSLFTFKMGGDDETTTTATTTESQNSKLSSNSSSANNSIERHNNNNKGSNGTDLKQYLKNFMLFSNLEIESEKKCRDEQLSKIVKALMLFEKKLRKEQEIIQQQLCEKDQVINRQMHTITNMKVKFGVDDGGNEDDAAENNNETAEFCPMCRKKYYLRATKSTAIQTANNVFSNNISDDYSSIQSIEYMSSSEEQEVLHSPNPFSTARRSKKYTSKKSYKEYLQSRPHSHNGSIDGNNNTRNRIINPKDFPGSDKNNNSIQSRSSNDIINGLGRNSAKGSGKFSLIMNDIHGIKSQQKAVDDTHSLKVNRMHGISLTTLNHDDGSVVSTCSSIDTDDTSKTTVSDDKNESHDNSNCSSTITNESPAVEKTRKYCDEDLEVKQKIITRDDWYISDIDENDTIGVTKSPYGNVSGVSNSVLECVNQILLQQSMDEYIESQKENKPKETKDGNSPSTAVAPTRTKRVHFSTKNSMVQIKPLPRHQHHHSMPDDTTYENQSTYSNEYELIGSSRTYVDMDPKSTIDNFKPTLPPKPSNLMKLQQISKQRAFVQDQIYSKKANSDYELNESEPDYASIAEIQDTIKVVTAEIHNDAIDNEYSEIKEVPSTPSIPEYVNEDDSFADVPKLPNVYSIIPGIETSPSIKKDSPSNNKCIGHDNYITKSPMKKKVPIGSFIPSATKKDKVKILTELNNVTNKKQQHQQQQPVQPQMPIKHQQTIKIIDEQIQQEFEMYNLDAEYTKTVTPQIENIKEMYQFDDENTVNTDDSVIKVEYNLEDFEYETLPSSECSINGIEIETNNNNFTTVIKINESSSSSTCEMNEQPPVSPVSKKSTATTNLMELVETPRVDFKKSNKIRYEKFLKDSGLISKPILMSKKKFYAEGSFV